LTASAHKNNPDIVCILCLSCNVKNGYNNSEFVSQRAKTNKNVDIKFNAHDTFLEYASSGTLKIERLECQIIKNVGSNKTKGP
jgi:hypothetical protein